MADWITARARARLAAPSSMADRKRVNGECCATSSKSTRQDKKNANVNFYAMINDHKVFAKDTIM